MLLNISGRNPVQYMICDFQHHHRGVIHDENYWCRRKQHWRTKGIDIGFKAKTLGLLNLVYRGILNGGTNLVFTRYTP